MATRHIFVLYRRWPLVSTLDREARVTRRPLEVQEPGDVPDDGPWARDVEACSVRDRARIQNTVWQYYRRQEDPELLRVIAERMRRKREDPEYRERRVEIDLAKRRHRLATCPSYAAQVRADNCARQKRWRAEHREDPGWLENQRQRSRERTRLWRARRKKEADR